MARGRKSNNIISLYSYEDIFWKNLPVYIKILNNYLNSIGFDLVEVGSVLDKLPFKLPKGLNSKEIKTEGIYPVISQSKDFIIGYSDNKSLLVKEKLPLILFGDHSKTIKYIENPFIIGADGVKILKPIKTFNEKFFYYFLHGVITDTKDYGRHFSLLRKGFIANVSDLDLQNYIVNFLDDLKNQSIDNDKVYFDKQIENKIYNVQINQLNQIEISSELTHQLDLIKQLRQAFLREAMQGKLVDSAPLEVGSETGHDLLAKIKAEKAQLIAEKKLKKEKELPPITEEEIPFEIPEHWAWGRLGEIGRSTIGIIFNPSQVGSIGIPVLRANNIQNNLLDYSNLIYVNTDVRDNQIADIGDILLCVRSGSNNLIGKACLIDKKGMSFGAFMSLYRSGYNPFVFKFMISDLFKNQINDKKSTGINQLTQGTLNNIIIPLPPLQEQEQIVAKLEELMAYCDGLEQSIKESQGYNEQLLQQVLREALQGETVINE